MRKYTVAELITRIRQRSDIENSQVCTDSELISYIDAAYGDYYSFLVNKAENYFVSDETITTTTDQNTYDLPEDFFKLLGIDKVVSSSKSLTLFPFNFNERNKHQSGFAPSYDQTYRYVLFGNKLKFIPTPTANLSFKVWYIPAPEKITVDTQEIDGVAGWEEFVVLKCCVRVMTKQELDSTSFERDLANVEMRMIQSSTQRDTGMQQGITDVTSLNDDDWLY